MDTFFDRRRWTKCRHGLMVKTSEGLNNSLLFFKSYPRKWACKIMFVKRITYDWQEEIFTRRWDVFVATAVLVVFDITNGVRNEDCRPGGRKNKQLSLQNYIYGESFVTEIVVGRCQVNPGYSSSKKKFPNIEIVLSKKRSTNTKSQNEWSTRYVSTRRIFATYHLRFPHRKCIEKRPFQNPGCAHPVPSEKEGERASKRRAANSTWNWSNLCFIYNRRPDH